MNKPHKHAKEIHAWADGAEIQRFCGDGWYDDSDTPEWYEDAEYRIKPRPVTKEGWVNIHKAKDYLAQMRIWESESEARANCFVDCVATVKVEWEEEVE